MRSRSRERNRSNRSHYTSRNRSDDRWKRDRYQGDSRDHHQDRPRDNRQYSDKRQGNKRIGRSRDRYYERANHSSPRQHYNAHHRAPQQDYSAQHRQQPNSHSNYDSNRNGGGQRNLENEQQSDKQDRHTESSHDNSKVESSEDDDNGESSEDEDVKLKRLIEARKLRQQQIIAKHAHLKPNETDTAGDSNHKTLQGQPSNIGKVGTEQLNSEKQLEHEQNEKPNLAPQVSSEQPDDSDSVPKQSSASNVASFDIFSIAAKVSENKTTIDAIAVPTISSGKTQLGGTDNLRLTDNWDDAEGYYQARIGSTLDQRYTVRGRHGQGMFSSVLICDDATTITNNGDSGFRSVAIKVIRNNDTMRRACQKEVMLLKEIAKSDPHDKRHCVRLLDYFEHRNHPCMVFENMNQNLRETLDQFGKGVGISLEGTHHFARQLVVALAHLNRLGIVHADIKPDNILVDSQQRLKLCDFGSAFKEDDPENRPTPYLVSRYYRAPEIILGLRYGMDIDTWSAACCFFEVYVGSILFPGDTNNGMLKHFMDAKGKFSNKMIRKHFLAYVQLQKDPHFTPEYEFKMLKVDPVTQNPVIKLQTVTERPSEQGIRTMLMGSRDSSEPRRKVEMFGDLLDKMLALDPGKRLSIKTVLDHPFFVSYQKQKQRKPAGL